MKTRRNHPISKRSSGLRLRAETVRVLADRDAVMAAGGATVDPIIDCASLLVTCTGRTNPAIDCQTTITIIVVKPTGCL